MKLSRWFLLLALLLTLGCETEPFLSSPPASGEVLFQDDFSVRSPAWTRIADEGGVMDYSGEIFRILVRAPYRDYWTTPSLNFGDVQVDVDALKYAGADENRIGLICRYVDGEHFYFFVISSDGYYGIGKTEGEKHFWLGQEEMQRSEAIHAGGQINHLRAVCRGSALMFYVNDSPVALATDSSYAQGDVGMLAGSFDEGGVDILFDNFVVTQP
jgi:hypothetical protein